ncbi:hypothetical protein DLNHIDIE_03567 [Acidithiobacillus thiooxidans ATCC 19377]|uniref:Uncharacterized protein n=1 Tax=Acidithiobacillus thiooxidans ATCC 19377 TaxID=637390 RepID=A0A543PYF8_ACITH|nr:hypothetical protein DLNHIDIE_03567 [Acidithiobacillus thiooxidans ATCC 19377]
MFRVKCVQVHVAQVFDDAGHVRFAPDEFKGLDIAFGVYEDAPILRVFTRLRFAVHVFLVARFLPTALNKYLFALHALMVAVDIKIDDFMKQRLGFPCVEIGVVIKCLILCFESVRIGNQVAQTREAVRTHPIFECCDSIEQTHGLVEFLRVGDTLVRG